MTPCKKGKLLRDFFLRMRTHCTDSLHTLLSSHCINQISKSCVVADLVAVINICISVYFFSPHPVQIFISRWILTVNQMHLHWSICVLFSPHTTAVTNSITGTFHRWLGRVWEAVEEWALPRHLSVSPLPRCWSTALIKSFILHKTLCSCIKDTSTDVW